MKNNVWPCWNALNVTGRGVAAGREVQKMLAHIQNLSMKELLKVAVQNFVDFTKTY